MQFYARFQDEVIAEPATIAAHVARSREQLGDSFAVIFDQALVSAHETLAANPADPFAKVDFVTLYHLVIESTLGLTAFEFITRLDPLIDAERIAAVGKALAEPLRVQIVDVLRRSEQRVCQCELLALFGINQSLLSHHMKKLVDVGLVEVERRHKWAYYSVSPDALKELTTWLG